MPNHVHLVLAPSDPAGLALTLSRAHRLYAGYFNARARQTGHLFQGRFGSLAMDEDHLIAAVRYVALNPVRARLVARASEWPHSSVRAHMAGVDDALVSVQPLRDRVANFADLRDTDPDDPEFNALRRNELIGRPLGSPDFLDAVSRQLNRVVTRSKRGRKPKAAAP
jgi:putative transposase